jgi:hypothetical protein
MGEEEKEGEGNSTRPDGGIAKWDGSFGEIRLRRDVSRYKIAATMERARREKSGKIKSNTK